jgi:hypothetical protein
MGTRASCVCRAVAEAWMASGAMTGVGNADQLSRKQPAPLPAGGGSAQRKSPLAAGLGRRGSLGGLLGSALKRELRGIIFFPRLFEGDVG